MIICKDCGKRIAPEECRNLKVNDPKETFGFRLDQLCEECYQKRLLEKAASPIGPDEEKKPLIDVEAREVIGNVHDNPALLEVEG